MRSGGGGSALIAGASIAAVELPTAVPYFAVIAGIVASSASVAQAIALLALYCAAFVLPRLAITVILLVAGERADRWLQRGAAWLQRRLVRGLVVEPTVRAVMVGVDRRRPPLWPGPRALRGAHHRRQREPVGSGRAVVRWWWSRGLLEAGSEMRRPQRRELGRRYWCEAPRVGATCAPSQDGDRDGPARENPTGDHSAWLRA